MRGRSAVPAYAAKSSRRRRPAAQLTPSGRTAFDAHARRDVLTRALTSIAAALPAQQRVAFDRLLARRRRAGERSPGLHWPARFAMPARPGRTSSASAVRRAIIGFRRGAAMTIGGGPNQSQPQCASVKSEQRQRGEQCDCRGDASATAPRGAGGSRIIRHCSPRFRCLRVSSR